jgi:hypothetical protein
MQHAISASHKAIPTALRAEFTLSGTSRNHLNRSAAALLFNHRRSAAQGRELL